MRTPWLLSSKTYAKAPMMDGAMERERKRKNAKEGDGRATYLISDYFVFQQDPINGHIKRLEPVCVDINLSQSDPRTAKWSLDLPRELVDRILEHVVAGHLRCKEFQEAAAMATIDVGMTRRWHQRYIEGRAWAEEKTTPVRRAITGIFRTVRLVAGLFDMAFDTTLFESNPSKTKWPIFDVDLDDEEWDVEEDHEMERFQIPVVSLLHPYSYSVGGQIKPTHMVRSCSLHSDMGCAAGVSIEVRGYITARMEGFSRKNPVIGWTGDRVGDLVLLDAERERGTYKARQALHPVLLLRIDVENPLDPQTWAGEWDTVRGYWKKLADLVHLSMEGTELFLEKHVHGNRTHLSMSDMQNFVRLRGVEA